MAIMIPSIPLKFTPASNEDKIFYALKNLRGDLNDKKNDYYVFHSLRINQIDKKTNTLVLHETDFVIFHPSKGILCIESKSGKAICRERVWHYAKADEDGIWKIGSVMSHGGPFQQAQDRMHDLLQYIDNQQVNSHGDPNKSLKTHCKALFAVCFPKIESVDETYKIKEKNEIIQKSFEDNFNGTENIKDLVIYGGELNDEEALKDKIDNIFDLNIVNSYAKDSRNGEGTIKTGYENGERLHDEDIQNLFDRVLCPNFNIVETIDSNTGETKYVQMNEDQIRVLDILMTKKEMAISGMAGTGKTILALQLARKKALQDEKVLFLCRSSYQKKELEEQEKSRQGNRAKIIFRDIDWLKDCWKNYDKTPVEDKNGFYDFICVCIAKEAGKKKKNFKLDTIIVDEAQDFCKDEAFDSLTVLYESTKAAPFLAKSEDELLKQRFRERTTENKNAFYIFYDEFQTDDDKNILKFAQEIKNHIELEKNCRNTINIAKTALELFTDIDSTYCQRKDVGEKIKIDFFVEEEDVCSVHDKKQNLCLKLDNILRTYKLEPDNTVILTFKSYSIAAEGQPEKSRFLNYPDCFITKDGRSLKTIENPAEIKEIYYVLDKDKRFLFTNWKNFQGLERRNIVFVDFDYTELFKLEEDGRYSKPFYVALTRVQDSAYFLLADPGYEGDTDESRDFSIEILEHKIEYSPQLMDKYSFDDYYRYVDQLEKVISKNPEFKNRVKEVIHDDRSFKKLSVQSDIPEDILSKYWEVLNDSDWHECIKESEQERIDFYNACKRLNEKYYETYLKYRNINRRLAICKALSAESLHPYDAVMLEAFNNLLSIGRKAVKIGLLENEFHKHINTMICIWQDMTDLFDDMYNVEGSDFIFEEAGFESSDVNIYYELIAARSKGVVVEILIEGWQKGVVGKGNDFWKSFLLFVELHDKLDCSAINQENLEKLKYLKREAMLCYFETVEKLKSIDIPKADGSGEFAFNWHLNAEKDFKKKYFGYLSLV